MKRFELVKTASEHLLGITALILTINLGISVSTVNVEILNTIKWPITVSTIFFLFSIFAGFWLVGSAIEPLRKSSETRSLQRVSQLQFWSFMLGAIFMALSVFIRVWG